MKASNSTLDTKLKTWQNTSSPEEFHRSQLTAASTAVTEGTSTRECKYSSVLRNHCRVLNQSSSYGLAGTKSEGPTGTKIEGAVGPTTNSDVPGGPSKLILTPVIAIIAVIAGSAIVILSILLLRRRYQKGSRLHLPSTSGLADNNEASDEATYEVEPYDLKHMSILYTSPLHPHSFNDGNEASTALNSPRNSIISTIVTTSALTERQIQLRDETEVLREQIKILQQAVLSSNVELQREIARMGAHIQRLESAWNSDWARGISDDPPPHYES
ncbi:hypothetical protein K435DRAFT_809469 [Dendrothele bispora CBS 962.96]|uniref:Uncharacterized protein n=1 Tax=Dendrothele bispora (strain CBS 962.96) TaxID=1314807 RepID=A0A4S8KYI6_DENBC|nr:hypothetical protein K435DRAFT_809469 [Dendrothele bispora CBS 962.96]